MKKILLVIVLAVLIAQPAHASLSGYYKENGKPLPSLKVRAKLYSSIASEKYFGTTVQNKKLENYLRGDVGEKLLGANTQFGMPCYFPSTSQTLSSGQGTALLCDEQGRLIITN